MFTVLFLRAYGRNFVLADVVFQHHVGNLETDHEADSLLLACCGPSCANGPGHLACGWGSLCSLLGPSRRAASLVPFLLAPGSCTEAAPVDIPLWCHRWLGLRAPGPLYLPCPQSPADLSLLPLRVCLFLASFCTHSRPLFPLLPCLAAITCVNWRRSSLRCRTGRPLPRASARSLAQLPRAPRRHPSLPLGHDRALRLAHLLRSRNGPHRRSTGRCRSAMRGRPRAWR